MYIIENGSRLCYTKWKTWQKILSNSGMNEFSSHLNHAPKIILFRGDTIPCMKTISLLWTRHRSFHRYEHLLIYLQKTEISELSWKKVMKLFQAVVINLLKKC